MSEAARRVRPFWGRVSVMPSPVDEEELPSGLVLPLRHEGGKELVRGVVERVDENWSHPDMQAAADQLKPGTVVYYQESDELPRIRGLVILKVSDVFAVEDE